LRVSHKDVNFSNRDALYVKNVCIFAKQYTIMAKPIKETPVLKGQEAKKFLTDVKALENTPIAQTEKDKIKASYFALKAILK